VTGGAGYIGSTTALLLADSGYDVVVADNLCRGHREAVQPGRLREIDILDTAALVELLTAEPCDAVIHFAAFIAVGESMKTPAVYFRNNLAGSLSLFTAMQETGVKNIVFSSTAAVYGIPESSPIGESAPLGPVNAYGESKLMVEKLLRWFDEIHGIRSIALRYFNASGCDLECRTGESHHPETHLIPLLFRAIRTGQPVTLFGDDYPTPDGTCIRDYIHVSDLAGAHILALKALAAGAPSAQYNAGTGKGYSVKEVVAAVEQVTGLKVPAIIGPRRDGDPPALVADSTRLQAELGWKPQHSDLATIVRTAWLWENRLGENRK
jgi:UDP-glucose-4-epimerase GalE